MTHEPDHRVQLAGVVTSFSEARGLGEILATSGHRYRFHCTQLLDGSRTMPVGTAVSFVEFDHPVGGTEATGIARIER
jgi:hypothetical protein